MTRRWLLRNSETAARFLRRLRPLAVLSASVLCCAAERPSEYDVKAAFLLNFTKFVEWPPASFASADSPLAICVAAPDPFGPVLDQMVEGETVNGRKVVVRRIVENPSPGACQVLYVGAAVKGAREALASVGSGVLTVGEGQRFLRDGGMIAFVIDNRRVRFDINQSAADSASLRLSSKLLSVARVVEK